MNGRRGKVARLCLVGLASAWLLATHPTIAPASAQSGPPTSPLSPYWGPDIQQWAAYISALAGQYGFHPDLVAAVIQHEMLAADAGGLAPVSLLRLPAGSPAPTTDGIPTPANDLRWGMTILAHVVQQSGGDLFTALAAYNGGWGQVEGRAAQEYAAQVLDSYARALVAVDGRPPNMAGRWTVAVEIHAGDVPAESLIVLGVEPLRASSVIATQHAFAVHTVYAFAGENGRPFHIRGYPVPLGLAEFVADGDEIGETGQLEAPLRARLGDKSAHATPGNPRVLLACLPSLERLRGQVTTRWYSPSNCPEATR